MDSMNVQVDKLNFQAAARAEDRQASILGMTTPSMLKPQGSLLLQSQRRMAERDQVPVSPGKSSVRSLDAGLASTTVGPTTDGMLLTEEQDTRLSYSANVTDTGVLREEIRFDMASGTAGMTAVAGYRAMDVSAAGGTGLLPMRSEDADSTV